MIVPHVVLELKNVLDEIVAVGIFDQNMDPANDNIGERDFLRRVALLEAPLHNAAAVLVSADLVTVGHARVEYELSEDGKVFRSNLVRVLWLLGCLESKEELLDDMIAVLMRRKVKDILGHLGADSDNLVLQSKWIFAKHFNHSLDDPGTMQIHGDIDDEGQ